MSKLEAQLALYFFLWISLYFCSYNYFIYFKHKTKIDYSVVRDLVSFVQFKECEEHPWRSVTFSNSNTPRWVLFTFLKSYK